MAAPDQLDYAQQGTDLPKGASQDLNSAIDFASQAPSPVEVPTETAPASSVMPGPSETSGYDRFLLSPTSRPSEPLSTGAGQVEVPAQSTDAFLRQYASNVIAQGSAAPDAALQWAIKVLSGQ